MKNKIRGIIAKVRVHKVQRLRADIPQWVYKKTDKKVRFHGNKTNWRRNRLNVK